MDDKIERAYKIKDLPDWLKERINLKHIENIDKKEYIIKNINEIKKDVKVLLNIFNENSYVGLYPDEICEDIYKRIENIQCLIGE